MGFSQFTYWRNDVFVSDKTPIKKIPKGGTEKLIFYKIQNGEYNESPYWSMSLKCISDLNSEVTQWREKNPRVSEEAFDDWYCQRRRVYNKKIMKLQEEHQRLELKRLNELQLQFMKDFKLDEFPVNLDEYDGTLNDLYYTIKELCQ